MSRFRRWLGRLTGTHIFRTLPRGIDLAADLQRWLPRFHPEVVFDVGAHLGQSAERSLRWFPAARLYCFEPAAESFTLLELHVGGSGRARCYRLALGEAPGRATIRLDGPPDMYAIEREDRPGPPSPTEEVPLETIDRFCLREDIARIGLLKIDTEGHDLAVLHGAELLLARQAVDLIQVEAGWHPGNRRQVPAEDFRTFLEPRGYRLFGIYQQVGEWPTGQPHLRRADLVFVSEPARTGRDPDLRCPSAPPAVRPT